MKSKMANFIFLSLLFNIWGCMKLGPSVNSVEATDLLPPDVLESNETTPTDFPQKCTIDWNRTHESFLFRDGLFIVSSHEAEPPTLLAYKRQAGQYQTKMRNWFDDCGLKKYYRNIDAQQEARYFGYWRTYTIVIGVNMQEVYLEGGLYLDKLLNNFSEDMQERSIKFNELKDSCLNSQLSVETLLQNADGWAKAASACRSIKDRKYKFLMASDNNGSSIKADVAERQSFIETHMRMFASLQSNTKKCTKKYKAKDFYRISTYEELLNEINEVANSDSPIYKDIQKSCKSTYSKLKRMKSKVKSTIKKRDKAAAKSRAKRCRNERSRYGSSCSSWASRNCHYYGGGKYRGSGTVGFIYCKSQCTKAMKGCY